MRLDPNREIVGILDAFEDENNFCNLQFSCTVEIEIPSTAIPFEQLSKLVGKRIGIFNCDDWYKIRVIEGNKYV